MQKFRTSERRSALFRVRARAATRQSRPPTRMHNTLEFVLHVFGVVKKLFSIAFLRSLPLNVVSQHSESTASFSYILLVIFSRAHSAFKQRAINPIHLLHFQRKKVCLSPFAGLKETAEKVVIEDPGVQSKGSESLIRNELSALDAYFNKLQGKASPEAPTLDSKAKEVATDREVATTNELPVVAAEPLSQDDSVKTDLRTIERYLENLSTGKQPSSPADVQKSERELESLIKEIAPSLQLLPVQEVVEDQSKSFDVDPSNVFSTESYVVYVLAAINIAVYLFGLASPVDTAGMGTSTLPLLYGAKVNELLLNGEWWRLITPMFLHSGFFHIALSSWALLFFGPQVENVFGPLAFCMIYFLGGLCGNIFSFFLTPAATVGGTGPLFALFSAWVVYLWQNKRVLGEQSADYGIKATTLMGVLVLCLSCLLPTDEWIHVGAVLPGILFGSFAAPILQADLDGISSSLKNRDNREEPYAIFDSPSLLSLSVVFVLSTGLCFTIFNILAAIVENSQFLDNTPL
ncbi:hypothetical protein GOP47_0014786 [Adiantum capillus-veneris]|uniref:Peptidase S54 rhomboid domain-containing protein n=1 Tax=Adiantum capillus-veneris TaxID=13818 RepID=A0A9D4UND3_ADICA|nr:hypothetical protein GOP47_0014786 [Adiantum capillus-veneris]